MERNNTFKKSYLFLNPLNIFHFFHFLSQFLLRPIKETREIIKNLILQYGGEVSKLKILDFGCGEGIFSRDFRNTEIGYYGVDKDFNHIYFAKKFYHIKYLLLCNEEICFKDRSFDFIILNNVLHHLTLNIKKKMLSEIKRVQKEQGKLIVIELFPQNKYMNRLFRFIISIEKKIRNSEYHTPDFYYNFFQDGFENIYYNKINNNFYILLFQNNYSI